ncbi:hypothetical protein L6452_34180 [Arctium lappa]|uniref:Uncharacterized protein n=1 Tax=Arctium lappa TaxID=4217 RepID=A0ACB8YHM2_ARCLA|nr:hypothetical protein L6452_34180 [Arctium lappa]
MIEQEWDTERWKAKSRTGKANRLTEFDGVSSRHVGGSISTGQHRYKMRRFRELKDDVEASQTPDSPPIDEAALWEQSAGGRKKGRIFGWSTQDPRYAMTGECSSSSGGRSSGTASADELAALREQMAKMEEDVRLREERYLAQLEIERKRNEEL